MSMVLQKVSHALERQAVGAMVDGLLKNLDKDVSKRSETYVKMVDMAEKFWGENANKETLAKVRKAVADPENRWMKFINRVLDETNPHVARTMILNLGYEAFFRGTRTIRKNREKYGCNIPWLILFDPTNACNMHCTGCWSGTYGHKSNLSYEDMDKIVTEGKELGVYLYMLTGGEPLVRKKDILRLAEQHNDAVFALFDNSTLIDEDFCKEVVRLGNITFQLSIEGTPETNDSRRGAGHYDAAMKAMDLFKKYGILFGTSICYTRDNIEAVSDEKFIRMIADKGARFGFYFHYMPVGNNAVLELMPTLEQRRKMIEQIRYIRSPQCDVGFFPMDFQNDGEFVGGCIAGGRNYFHINAHGDAEPCVFIHFSDSNIHTHSILEMLQSPLFMEYHKGQPFNRNHLRPCPMLENPQYLREMVARTGAHGTNDESEETVEHLCGKCDENATKWGPVADEIWAGQTHKRPKYENYTKEKREHPELAGFDTCEEKKPLEYVGRKETQNEDHTKAAG
ncbi:MAG: radical SAM protein [Lachnospiraceae bacterium]|nr:radical SAM protein [Lachnospiraceae bacterium]